MVAKPRTRKKSTAASPAKAPQGRWQRVRFWALRGMAGVLALWLALVLAFAVVPPPINIYQMSESWRLGGIKKDWVAWDEISPDLARAVVAAEDANFCRHWGFDMAAIRDAIEDGGGRGASTLSQQVVKNTFLWQGRSWPRKALEAAMTPVVELVWTKRRILHVYLNTAEMAEGVFGAEAAARHYFGVSARDLTPVQAARLAAVLPNPKERDAANPSGSLRKRASSILAGAETIAADGRADCFLPED